jgi:chromosome segregation ATPase
VATNGEKEAAADATPRFLQRIQGDIAELKKSSAATNGRLDTTNSRLDRLEDTMKRGFDGVVGRLDTLIKTVMQSADTRFDDHEGRIRWLENKAGRTATVLSIRRKPKKHRR